MITGTEEQKRIKLWYIKTFVWYEIVRMTYNREFAALIPSYNRAGNENKSTRNLRCHNVQHFDFFYRRGFRMLEREFDYNFYYSLASYKNGIPKFSFNLAERDTAEWNNNHWREMSGFDLLIDIDAADHSAAEIAGALSGVREILRVFDYEGVPYELRFSGCGFHIVVPFAYFAHLELSFNPADGDLSIYNLYARIVSYLEKHFSEMVDKSSTDSRQLLKIPYTLALYGEEGAYVCAPLLERAEVRDFDIKKYELNNYIFPSPEILRKSVLFNQGGTIKYLLKIACGVR